MSLPQNAEQSKTNRFASASPVDSNTVCAVITGEGRSAIAVVAVAGSGAAEFVSKCFQPATQRPFSPGEIRFGLWTGPHHVTGEAESVVVTPMDRDRIEIQCHGGPAAVSRIVDDLRAVGAKPIEDAWELESGQELMVREAAIVLSRCVTAKTAAIALNQMRGGLRVWAQTWLERIENDPKSVETLRGSAADVARGAMCTSRLADPFRVVLWGPPNVGKSSLLNAIVGFDRSITLDSAGTTRDVLHAETVIDGLPVRLSDTAGIRDSEESIEQKGIVRAQSTASAADVLVCVTEPALADETEAVMPPTGFPNRFIRVLNKIDLATSVSFKDSYDVATCAISGRGIAELMRRIAESLQSVMPASGDPAAINRRQADLVETIAATPSRAVLTRKLRQLLDGCDETSPPTSASS